MLDLPVLAAGIVGISLGFVVSEFRRRGGAQPLADVLAVRQAYHDRDAAERRCDEALADCAIANDDAIDARTEMRETLEALDREKAAHRQTVRERNRLRDQALFWAGASAKTTRLMIDMGAAREAAGHSTQPPREPSPRVVVPFGRRQAPSTTPPLGPVA